MDSIQISKIAYDSIQTALKYDVQLSQSKSQTELYLWILGIAATIILGLISFIAYSWNGTNFLDYYGNIVQLNPPEPEPEIIEPTEEQ